jgi:hypothetical protein
MNSEHHGMYVINRDGTKLVSDNVIFDNYAYGIQVYASPGQALNNVHLDGNVSFNNGSIWSGVAKPNILVGGSGVPASGMVVTNNTLYYSQPVDVINLRLGYDATQNADISVKNNYAVGGTPVMNVYNWTTATIADNTFVGTDQMTNLVQVFSHTWSGNTWYRDPAASAWEYAGTSYTFAGWQEATGLSATDQATAQLPNGVRVVVRPNKYDVGRAHVTINNWSQQSSVAVDLSQVLHAGDRYEVHSVQDLFGAPVASGTYDGGSVMIPMRAITPPQTIGRTSPLPPPTGPTFDVFLVTLAP